MFYLLTYLLQRNVFLVLIVLSLIISVTDVFLMDTSRTYRTLSYKHITLHEYKAAVTVGAVV